MHASRLPAAMLIRLLLGFRRKRLPGKNEVLFGLLALVAKRAIDDELLSIRGQSPAARPTGTGGRLRSEALPLARFQDQHIARPVGSSPRGILIIGVGDPLFVIRDEIHARGLTLLRIVEGNLRSYVTNHVFNRIWCGLRP